MTLVTVTGYARNGAQEVVPASLDPRLFFRPAEPFVSSGLHSDYEVQADLTASTGAFTVELESDRHIRWVPVLDWLVPGTENEPPEMRARGHTEWPPFFPGNGGPIGDLYEPPRHGQIPDLMYGFGPLTSWPWEIVYLNLSDPAGVGVYGPQGSSIDEWSGN